MKTDNFAIRSMFFFFIFDGKCFLLYCGKIKSSRVLNELTLA